MAVDVVFCKQNISRYKKRKKIYQGLETHMHLEPLSLSSSLPCCRRLASSSPPFIVVVVVLTGGRGGRMQCDVAVCVFVVGG